MQPVTKHSTLGLLIGICLAFSCSTSAQTTTPSDFPAFRVPEHEADMKSLRALYWLHYENARPLVTLWDEWMPHATLWPARDGANRQSMRDRWAAALASREINNDG